MMEAKFDKGRISGEEPKKELAVIELTKETRARAECVMVMASRINSCLFGGGAGPASCHGREASCLAEDLLVISIVLDETCKQLEMIQKNLGM